MLLLLCVLCPLAVEISLLHPTLNNIANPKQRALA